MNKDVIEIPKFYETFIPILEVLKDGKVLHYNELRKQVRDLYYSDLPEELLKQRTKSGDLLILNRIGWAKAFLKVGKFIQQPERALVQITEKGKNVLEKGNLSLSELKQDPDYLAHESSKVERQLTTKGEVIDIDSASPQDLIDTGFTTIETQLKNDLLERLKNIDPYYFEKVILKLLNKMGYGDVIETSKSADGGIDGIINQDKLGLEIIYMQAKCYRDTKIHETHIRDFIGAMSTDAKKGIIVTTTTFDNRAIQKAEKERPQHIIIMIDGNKLVELMLEYSVGVQVSNTYAVKKLDEDFFEEN